MSNTSGTTQLPPAPQSLAWEILGPEMVGWIVQIFVSGACFQKATSCYSSRSALGTNVKRILTVVLLLNGTVFVSTIAEMLLWSTTQRRDEGSLYGFTVPDAYQPIPAGLIQCVVQCFFAHRAWTICDRSMVFLILISVCIFLSLGGALGLGVVQLQIVNQVNAPGWNSSLVFTELWTWTSGITDLIISLVIISGLLSKRTGYSMPTDSLMMKIVNAAMQSASMTTTFTLAAAIVYAILWKTNGASVDLTFMYPIPALYTYSLLWCLATKDHVLKEHRLRNSTGASFVTPPIHSGATMGPFSPYDKGKMDCEVGRAMRNGSEEGEELQFISEYKFDN